jgi:hypothetical protein
VGVQTDFSKLAAGTQPARGRYSGSECAECQRSGSGHQPPAVPRRKLRHGV